MRRSNRRYAAFAALFAALPCTASSAADYFEGKKISLTIGLPPGGGFDLYARILTPYWQRHIPGKPTILVLNRPGAGSVTAANYVYNIAAPDGTQLAMTLDVTPIFQLLGVAGVDYDVSRMSWVGNMTSLTGHIVLWHTAPATSIEDVRKKEVIIGTTGGKQGQAYIFASMMKAFTGAKFRIIGGYAGSALLDPALERGEIHGRSVSWNSYIISKPHWIKEKKVIPLVQIGLKKDPNLPNVPMITELATSEEGRKALELISTTSAFSRAIWGPPGMPKEALDILRKSFDATMRDPEFLADAEKRKFYIDPMTGVEVEAQAKKLLATPAGIVKAAKAAVMAQ
ncbi:MAG: Bug family tripartite tricarboxylate transporter substrate binding protein [Hyphomicrobiaceae bacterium]